MKISDLKQPYKRMAEYLVDINPNELFDNKHLLRHGFTWSNTDGDFWDEVDNGKHPNITLKIKTHFPSDFDFSGEDEYPNNQCDEACYYHCTEGGKINPKCINEKYTQLAKEGKFDELPDTCEFSEPVNLRVWDNELMEPINTNVLGKFKGLYITQANLCWKYAKTITKIK